MGLLYKKKRRKTAFVLEKKKEKAARNRENSKKLAGLQRPQDTYVDSIDQLKILRTVRSRLAKRKKRRQKL